MTTFGTPSGISRTPGIRHQFRYNRFWFNRRGLPIYLPGIDVSHGPLDYAHVKSLTGFRDGDIRFASEPRSGADGEHAMTSLYGGRTFVLDGFLESGSLMRIEDIDQAMRQALEDLVESPMLIHDPRQDWIDFFLLDSLSKYTFSSGGGTASINTSTGQMVPSSTALKMFTLNNVTARDSSMLVGFLQGASTSTEIDIVLKYIDTSNYLMLRIDGTNVTILKRDVGSNSTIQTAVAHGGLAASTPYWIVGSILGNDIRLEFWKTHPYSMGVPTTVISHRLTGANATKFGDGSTTPRQMGLRWTPADTGARLNDLWFETHDNDVEVMCRKQGTMPSIDQQPDQIYRRAFQVTFRASSKDMLALPTKVVGRTIDAAAPASANQTFEAIDATPVQTGTPTGGRSWSDDSSYWSLESSLADGAQQSGGLLEADFSGGTPIVDEEFLGQYPSVTNMNGTQTDDGPYTWTTSGVAATDFRWGNVGGQDMLVRDTTALEATPRIAILAVPNRVDQHIELVAGMSTNPGNQAAGSETETGIIFRYVDASNYGYAFGRLSNTGVTLVIGKRVGGTNTQITSFSIIGVNGRMPPTARQVIDVDRYGMVTYNLVGFQIQALDSVFATGGTLDDGDIGIWDRVSISGAFLPLMRRFTSLKYTGQPNNALTGMARYYDAFSASFPQIGDGTHELGVLFGESIVLNPPIGLSKSAYMVLKSIRGSNRYIALKLRGMWTGSYFRVYVSLVRVDTGTESVIVAEQLVWEDTSGVGAYPPPTGFVMQATVAGNAYSWSVTYQGQPAPVTGSTTLTSTNATQYGTGIQGETGIRIDQPATRLDVMPIIGISHYKMQEAGSNQTFTAINNGNAKSRPIVRMDGAFSAGSYILGVGPRGEQVGPFVLAKSLASGQFVELDLRTGIALDENGQLAGSRVSDTSEDLLIPPYGTTNFAVFGGWNVGTARAELRYRETWR
jgi:hypothetical protein